MATASWDDLSLQKQMALLQTMKPELLAKQFGRQGEFFKKARAFLDSAPMQTVAPKAKQHDPPKDLVVSARRDLSFFEANFELFDNSIDAWRKTGAKRDLHINVTYDQELNTGKYSDDAGGMAEEDVYKVFIPGETTNRNFDENVIGSFGMGAKKGIFRLTDGAKIISCQSKHFSATSEVPEKWELIPQWQTMDGRAKPITAGTTEIFLFRLFNPPTVTEIEELIERTQRTYSPLISGALTGKKVVIKINKVKVQPAQAVNWSAPEGAAPRRYRFQRTFHNFLRTQKDITLHFEFLCGLTRVMPGQGGGDRERGWGIDVYGNGRLIQALLKQPFGWGTAKMALTNQANNFIRGELFIGGHSFAIPWDTHKREYLNDHLVSDWLRARLRPIIKSYITIAGRFASDTDLRKNVLAKSLPEEDFEIVDLEENSPPDTEQLPSWVFEDDEEDEEEDDDGEDEGGDNDDSDTDDADDDDESDAEMDEDGPEARTVSITLLSSEYDELLQRFGVSTLEALGTAVHDCLVGGVVFALDAKQVEAALATFKADDLGDLAAKIKKQLVKNLKK